ncbi:MAG: LysR family transcriptional regulator [Roseobacter sp.]
MNKLQAIQVCRDVARQGRFAAAGRKLNTSTPSASRLVGDIEGDIGVRLFQRSTRKISLIEQRALFLNSATALADELDVLCDEIRARRTEPEGHLKASSVLAFGHEMIAPSVPKFLVRYPAVTVDL